MCNRTDVRCGLLGMSPSWSGQHGPHRQGACIKQERPGRGSRTEEGVRSLVAAPGTCRGVRASKQPPGARDVLGPPGPCVGPALQAQEPSLSWFWRLESEIRARARGWRPQRRCIFTRFSARVCVPLSTQDLVWDCGPPMTSS